MLRCFDGEVTHVDGSVDPGVRDAEDCPTELMIADLDAVEKRMAKVKRARSRVTRKPGS